MRIALGNKRHPSVKRFGDIFRKFRPDTRKFELITHGDRKLFDPTAVPLKLNQVGTLDHELPIIVTNMQNLVQARSLKKNRFICVKIDSEAPSEYFPADSLSWDYVITDNDDMFGQVMDIIIDVHRDIFEEMYDLWYYQNF